MLNETRGRLAGGRGPVPEIKKVSFGQHRIELYTIGWLSYLTSVAQVTLRLWEREGVLPKPIFKTGLRRYYSAPEIQGFTRYIEVYMHSETRNRGLLGAKLKEVSAFVANRYNSQEKVPPSEFPHELKELAAARKLKRALRSARTEALKKALE